MKKIVCFIVSMIIATTPVLAEKSPTTKNNGGGYDPCGTSNIALAASGCKAFVNGQWLTSNGNGTVTTESGNILDGNGNIIGHVGGTAANASANRAGSVPNTGDVDYSVYYLMLSGALIAMAGAGYILYTNKD